MRKLIPLIVMSLAAPSIARAEDGAGSPSTGSDSKGTVVGFPDLKLRAGRIRVSAFPARAEVGVFHDSKETGAHVELEGSHNFYLLGVQDETGTDHSEIGVLRVTAGGRVAADLKKDEAKRIEIESPRIGFGAAQMRKHEYEKDEGTELRRDPYFTGGFELASLGYQSFRLEGVNSKTQGADFRFLEMDLHAAADIGGTNLDFFAAMSGVVRPGSANGRDKTLVGMKAAAGLGVDLGVIGNLRGEIDYLGMLSFNEKPESTKENPKYYDDTTLRSVSLTARLDKPAGLPLSAAATYTNERAATGGPDSNAESYDKATFTMGGAF
jgi:hypothetical protein